MLLIDDLLASPWRSLVFVLREIEKAVRAEQAAAERRLLSELSELHRRLDQGEISEAEFDTSEQSLLDRLDGLRQAGGTDVGSDDRR